MLLYPVVDQYAGIMRFFYYPHIPSGSGYGLLFKGVDLSFYVDDDAVFTVDTSFCDHIGAGGLSSAFSYTVNRCGYYLADGGDGNTYIHFHFDLYGVSPTSQVISDDGSFYITVGTYAYNEQQDSPLVKRSIVFANLPLYFNGLDVGNISLQTSADTSLLEQNNQLLQEINNNISSIDNGEQQRWEQDREDMSNKEDELEDQADNLSLSADIPTNPFTSYFVTSFNSSACVRLSRVGAWFNNDNLVVCSPYPSSIRPALVLISNIFLFGLICRLYYKKLKGGFDG